MSEKPLFKSKTTLLLRDAWRKAHRRALNGGMLEIVFRNEAQAHKARMDLYKAIQAEKKGLGEDMELIEAGQTIEIVFAPDRRNVLWMRHRSQNDIYAALEEAVGEGMQTMVDPELVAGAQASLDQLGRMGIKIEGAVQDEDDLIAHKDNPFYGKR